MSDQYEPVRAWAEWDEWTGYWQSVAALESAWFIPKTGNGMAYNLGDMSLASMIEGQALGGYSLRSLRVLLRSGHEVNLEPMPNGGHPLWGAGLDLSNTSSDLHPTEYPNWYFDDVVTDDEAVSRALSEARRWLEDNEQ